MNEAVALEEIAQEKPIFRLRFLRTVQEKKLPHERVGWKEIDIKNLVFTKSGKVLDAGDNVSGTVVLQWKEMEYKNSYDPKLLDMVVIACHGFLANPEPYARLMRMMGELRGKVNFIMVAVNMPGHAQSSSELTFQETIDSVLQIPAVKKAKHLGVMGSSMGGALAMGLTLADDRVEMGLYDNPVQDPRLRILEAARLGLVAGLDALKSMLTGKANNDQMEESFPTADIPIILGSCDLLSKAPFKIAMNYFATIPNFDAQLEALESIEKGSPKARSFVANFIWSKGDTSTQNYRPWVQKRMKKMVHVLGGTLNNLSVEGGHTHGYRTPGTTFFTPHREAVMEFAKRLREVGAKVE